MLLTHDIGCLERAASSCALSPTENVVVWLDGLALVIFFKVLRADYHRSLPAFGLGFESLLKKGTAVCNVNSDADADPKQTCLPRGAVQNKRTAETGTFVNAFGATGVQKSF